MSNCKKIVIQLTGSIACYKACFLISKLVQTGHEVQCVVSEAALKFIGEATLEGLTDRPVLLDMFARRDSKVHITLTKWADLFLIYPASANTINALAAGLANNLIGALFLANNFKKPYWIAPAMNVNMYEHQATQNAIKTLAEWGVCFFETDEGILACGDIGKGRLIDPDAVFTKIEKEILL